MKRVSSETVSTIKGNEGLTSRTKRHILGKVVGTTMLAGAATLNALGGSGGHAVLATTESAGAVPAPAVVSQYCAGTQFVDGACYLWEGASQKNNGKFSAQGASVQFSQENPTLGKSYSNNKEQHSVVELWAASADDSQIIEVSWIKDGISKQTELAVDHWVNGKFAGFAEMYKEGASGFVQTSHTMKPGDPVQIGKMGSYGVVFRDNEWQVDYDGQEVGYYPELDWQKEGASFTSLGNVQVYGEAEINGHSPVTQALQMGNGIPGNEPGVAEVRNYKLIGSSTPADLVPYSIDNGQSSIYSIGDVTSTGFNYGGAGYVNSPQTPLSSVVGA